MKQNLTAPFVKTVENINHEIRIVLEKIMKK